MCNQVQGRGLRPLSWQRAHKRTREWRRRGEKDDSWGWHGTRRQNWMWFNHNVVPSDSAQTLAHGTQRRGAVTAPILTEHKRRRGREGRGKTIKLNEPLLFVAVFREIFLACPALPIAKPHDGSLFTNAPIVRGKSFSIAFVARIPPRFVSRISTQGTSKSKPHG